MRLTIIGTGRGSGYSLYGLVKDNACQIASYVQGLDEQRLKEVSVLFNEIRLSGPPKNIEKFRPLQNDIYELKTRSGVRFACFFGGRQLLRSLVITHGFPKGGAKVLKREIKKAVAWRQEYLGIKDISKRIVRLEVQP